MNPQALQCTLAVLDAHTARIVLSGDIVYDNGDRLLVLVDELLTVHGVRAIRLDCGGVGFCDSYGLSTLLAVHRRVTAAGRLAGLAGFGRQPAVQEPLPAEGLANGRRRGPEHPLHLMTERRMIGVAETAGV